MEAGTSKTKTVTTVVTKDDGTVVRSHTTTTNVVISGSATNVSVRKKAKEETQPCTTIQPLVNIFYGFF